MRRLLTISVALGLIAAGCGGGGNEAAPTTTVVVESGPVTTTTVPSAKLPPVPAGRHRYSVQGVASSTVAGSGTPVALSREYEWAPPSGDRQRFFAVDRPSEVTEIEYRDDGVYLVSFAENMGGTLITFAPSTPVLYLPLPATAGRTWSFEFTTANGCYVWLFDGRIDGLNVPVTIGAITSQTTQMYHGSTWRDSGKEGCTRLNRTAERTFWLLPDRYFFIRHSNRVAGETDVTNSTSEELTILRSGIPL